LTLFEFVSVMISIILGLSLTQALVGTANLARESKLVVGFAPYTLWVAGVILAHFFLCRRQLICTSEAPQLDPFV